MSLKGASRKTPPPAPWEARRDCEASAAGSRFPSFGPGRGAFPRSAPNAEVAFRLPTASPPATRDRQSLLVGLPYRILVPAWSAGSTTDYVFGVLSLVMANIMPLPPQLGGRSLSPPELRWRAAVSWKSIVWRGYDTHASVLAGPPALMAKAVGTSLGAYLIGRRPIPSNPGGQHQALVERTLLYSVPEWRPRAPPDR